MVDPYARVLDLGWGTGNNGIALKAVSKDIEVYGVDIIPEDQVSSSYKYESVDLDKGILPYPDAYFDIVLFTHVIEHLRSPLRLAKELERVMKKGAKIYVESPNWTTLFVPSFGFKRNQHSPFNFFDDHTHVKPWSKHGLFEFLSQGCKCHVTKLSNTRNWFEIPFDFLIIPWGTNSRQPFIGCFGILELIRLVHLCRRDQGIKQRQIPIPCHSFTIRLGTGGDDSPSQSQQRKPG